MADTKLYRIIRRTTNSLQPGSGGTYWQTTVLYCGYDRLEALRVFHESKPTDYWYGYGNRCAETKAQGKAVASAV